MSHNSHLTEEQIAKCADAIHNNTYDSIPEDIRQHIAECNICATEIMIISEISPEVEEELNNKKQKRLIINPWFIGATTLAAAALASLVVFEITNLSPDNETKQQLTVYSENDNIKAEKDKTEDIDTVLFSKKKSETEDSINISQIDDGRIKKSELAYIPNKNLEQLFQNSKGAYRSVSVEVKTPDTVYIEKNTQDTLSWVNPKNEKLIVEIFNNNEEEILIEETNNEYILTPDLKEGLYYWKLINKEFDLIFVGKIIVE